MRSPSLSSGWTLNIPSGSLVLHPLLTPSWTPGTWPLLISWLQVSSFLLAKPVPAGTHPSKGLSGSVSVGRHGSISPRGVSGGVAADDLFWIITSGRTSGSLLAVSIFGLGGPQRAFVLNLTTLCLGL